MAKEVTFEIDDNLTPVDGVLVLNCTDQDGENIIHICNYEDKKMRPSDIIGVLTIVLDQLRTIPTFSPAKSHIPKLSWRNVRKVLG